MATLAGEVLRVLRRTSSWLRKAAVKPTSERAQFGAGTSGPAVSRPTRSGRRAGCRFLRRPPLRRVRWLVVGIDSIEPSRRHPGLDCTKALQGRGVRFGTRALWLSAVELRASRRCRLRFSTLAIMCPVSDSSERSVMGQRPAHLSLPDARALEPRPRSCVSASSRGPKALPSASATCAE
jgi:hypothetical protein